MAKTTIETKKAWATLHIFGYGETQLIGDNTNKKVSSESLASLMAVIDSVYSFKPADSPATTEFHAINIFNEMFSDWQTKDISVKGWRTEYAELDKTLIEALVAEINAIPEVGQANI